jgi:hypothetical protein
LLTGENVSIRSYANLLNKRATRYFDTAISTTTTTTTATTNDKQIHSFNAVTANLHRGQRLNKICKVGVAPQKLIHELI